MNATLTSDGLPPLPEYSLLPLPPLFPPIPDKLTTLLLPVFGYWALSMFFHWIDMNDYFSRYRLHTPAEVLKRNHVTRWEVVRDVILQQIIQTAVGWLLGMTEPDDFYGKEEYDIMVWARRIRIVQRAIPAVLATIGLDASGIAKTMLGGHPMLAGAFSGGHYPALVNTVTLDNGLQTIVPAFASWEVTAAKAMYWFIVPAVQYFVAICFVDTWQYFLHRAMHMNKWLYTTFHSRHHRLYVPYAYGALYNHPFEGFLLDTLGASIAFKVAFMNTRQGMWFFTGSTFKTVDDHCGYALPWDPLQFLTSNNAGYHDVHHQSWGIKTNFSQPFFTFWDSFLGTKWSGGDVSARYERAKINAQKKLDAETSATQQQSITHSSASDSVNATTLKPYESEVANANRLASVPTASQQPEVPSGGKAEAQAVGSREQVLDDERDGGMQILAEEASEERDAVTAVRRSKTRSTASSLSGLREKVSIHGRTGGILGVEQST